MARTTKTTRVDLPAWAPPEARSAWLSHSTVDGSAYLTLRGERGRVLPGFWGAALGPTHGPDAELIRGILRARRDAAAAVKVAEIVRAMPRPRARRADVVKRLAAENARLTALLIEKHL